MNDTTKELILLKEDLTPDTVRIQRSHSNKGKTGIYMMLRNDYSGMNTVYLYSKYTSVVLCHGALGTQGLNDWVTYEVQTVEYVNKYGRTITGEALVAIARDKHYPGDRA